MSNRGNPWDVPAGMSSSFTVTISNESGAITGQYTGSEPLEAVVWEGSDLAPIAGVVSLAWLSATDGTVTATVAPPSGMAPGSYRVRLAVTFGGVTSAFYEGWLKVGAIPGTASESPTYGAYQDMVDLAGDWLMRLQQGDAGDQTNFVRERAMAREWLDDIIVGASRPYAYRFDLDYALYYGSFPYGPVEAPDAVMRGYLASNYLMVLPRTVECTSYKALAFACEKRISFDESGEQYRQRAQWYHRKAANSLRRYRCEIDTNQDGRADISFNLGIVTFR